MKSLLTFLLLASSAAFTVAAKPEFASVVDGFKAKLAAKMKEVRTNDLGRN